ncbi:MULTISPECIES: acyltransferase [Alicyclobacillus]|uniref:acyltransferase n=1 Tax=Alicyclobacillus TaxID=29330 RepID=UPI0022A6848B|nr:MULTISPECIES: acyltransferase [Alicyclobacillus]
MYEVDLMRACIILGVIFVHVFSAFDAQTPAFSRTNISLDLLTMAFHFTREAFMFITGLVLFYTYYDRTFTVWSFWRKRLSLIAVPYIAWTALYILFTGTYLNHFNWAWQSLAHRFGHALLTANQFFLYFLLVSMQLYVLFPLIVKMVRKLERHLWWLVSVSFALEIGIMVLNQTVLNHLDVSRLPTWLFILVHYRDRFILTYQFWFVAGAALSVKYNQVKNWVSSRPGVVGVAAVLGILVLWATYFVERFGLHMTDGEAVDVLQPIMIPYALIVATLLWSIGLKWTRVMAEPGLRRVTPVIRFFGGVSFGIFLLHPIALHYLEQIDNRLHLHGAAHLVLIPFTAVLAYVLSGFAAYLIGKIPFVSYIVGTKTRLRRSSARAPLSKAV